jgi:hypothetical protein
MANPTDMNDTTPGRRDREVGADLGQRGAQAQKEPTSPNKSQLGSDEVDSAAVRANDQGDDKNLGDSR